MEPVVIAESIALRAELNVRELYTDYSARLYRFGVAFCGSEARAAEAVQEVFLELLKRSEIFDPGRGSAAGLLYGMVRNRLRSARRREEREEPIGDDEPGEEDLLASFERAERVAAVREAILLLPEHYREVVLLCEIEECGYESAALALGVPVGTVRSRLSRAKQQLRRRLEEFERGIG